MLITDLAVFSRADRHARFDLIELAPGVTEADVRAKSRQLRTRCGAGLKPAPGALSMTCSTGGMIMS